MSDSHSNMMWTYKVCVINEPTPFPTIWTAKLLFKMNAYLCYHQHVSCKDAVLQCWNDIHANSVTE